MHSGLAVKRFQSTHSLRSATNIDSALAQMDVVSIHALLAECDWLQSPFRLFRMMFQSTHSLRSATVSLSFWPSRTDGFNPRTPCGVRLRQGKNADSSPWFQSTHSLRSATMASKITSTLVSVSIHALLAECDPARSPIQRRAICFNPRTPCGVRLRPTLYIATQQSKSYFAPTSLKRPSLHGCSF